MSLFSLELKTLVNLHNRSKMRNKMFLLAFRLAANVWSNCCLRQIPFKESPQTACWQGTETSIYKVLINARHSQLFWVLSKLSPDWECCDNYTASSASWFISARCCCFVELWMNRHCHCRTVLFHSWKFIILAWSFISWRSILLRTLRAISMNRFFPQRLGLAFTVYDSCNFLHVQQASH